MMNNLKELRAKAGLSLQALGDTCGMSKAQMHLLEKDTANPTIKNAYAIAKLFDVSVYDIWPDTTKIVEETVIIRRIVRGDENGL